MTAESRRTCTVHAGLRLLYIPLLFLFFSACPAAHALESDSSLHILNHFAEYHSQATRQNNGHDRAWLTGKGDMFLAGRDPSRPIRDGKHGCNAMVHALERAVEQYAVHSDALASDLDESLFFAAADNATVPLECILDYILVVENVVQGTIFFVHFLNNPERISDLVASYLTFVIALSRYFDYLECLLDE